MTTKIKKLTIELDSGKILKLDSEEYLDLCKKIKEMKLNDGIINKYVRIYDN